MTTAQLKADKADTALTLNNWVKTQPFLQALTLDQGEASVVLLLLWESRKRSRDTAAADAELSAWMHSRTKLRGVLSLGLNWIHFPPGLDYYTRWAVRNKPEVGSPSWPRWFSSSRVHGRDSSSTESRHWEAEAPTSSGKEASRFGCTSSAHQTSTQQSLSRATPGSKGCPRCKAGRLPLLTKIAL